MPGIVRRDSVSVKQKVVMDSEKLNEFPKQVNALPVMTQTTSLPSPTIMKPIHPQYADAEIYTEENSLIITDRNVVTYFQTHPHVNPESILLGFIRILKDLDINSDKEENLLNLMKESFGKLNSTLKDTIHHNSSTRNILADSINRSKQLLVDNLENSKKLITETITSIINQNSTRIYDELSKSSVSVHNINSQLQNQFRNHIQEICEKEMSRQNSLISQNVNTLLNDSVGKIMSELNRNNNSLDNIQFQIQNQIKQQIKEVCEIELSKQKGFISEILHSMNGSMPTNDMEVLKQKINESLSSISNKIVSQEYIESIVEKNLSEFSSDISNNITELSSLLQKPAIADTEVLLNKILPTACINKLDNNVYMVDKEETGNILVMEKNTHLNIPSKYVHNFVRECTAQTCHGVFISHKSGITDKDNFSVDLNNGKVLIYLSHTENNSNSIEEAFHVINSLIPYANAILNSSLKSSDKITSSIQTILNDYNAMKYKHNLVITNLEQQIDTIKSCDIPSLHKYIKNSMPEQEEVNSSIVEPEPEPEVVPETEEVYETVEPTEVEDVSDVEPEPVPPPPPVTQKRSKRSKKQKVSFEKES